MDSEEYSPELLNILWNKNPRRAFLALADFFLATTDVERALILQEWDFGRDWDIPRIRQIDMDHAVFGPLTGDEKEDTGTLLSILVYLILRGPDEDYREDMTHITLVHHIALEAGVDPEPLFARVALAGGPIATLLDDFQRRPPLDKSLWTAGYRKRRVDNDIEFVWIGNDPNYDEAKPTKLDRWGAEIEI